MNITTMALISIFFTILYAYGRAQQRGGIKKLFTSSREAPQHWDIFALLMGGVLFVVILLIKIG